MSDQTQNIHTAVTEGAQPLREHRVRKGPIRIRKRDKTAVASEGQASPEVRSDLSAESQQAISQAKAERLARRAARAEKRAERMAARKAAIADSNLVAPNATEDQKKAHLDELSSAKLRREQRRAERAERRALRKERRAEKKLNTDKLSKLSNKEKLSGLFGDKNTSSASTDNITASDIKDTASKKQHDAIQAELNENNHQNKIGAETLGAGQVGQTESAVDRISNKLKKAKSEDKEKSSDKHQNRLKNIFKKVKNNKADHKEDKEKAAAAKPELKKELSAEEAFMHALTTKLQDTGTKIDEFKNFRAQSHKRAL